MKTSILLFVIAGVLITSCTKTSKKDTKCVVCSIMVSENSLFKGDTKTIDSSFCASEDEIKAFECNDSSTVNGVTKKRKVVCY
jgi:hypothetical protein